MVLGCFENIIVHIFNRLIPIAQEQMCFGPAIEFAEQRLQFIAAVAIKENNLANLGGRNNRLNQISQYGVEG